MGRFILITFDFTASLDIEGNVVRFVFIRFDFTVIMFRCYNGSYDDNFPH